MSKFFSIKQTLALLAGTVLCVAASHAALFHVNINTSVLQGSANVPFSLDFQLNSGNTLDNNSAVISNFSFGGGGVPFGAASTFGGASGSLAGSVTLHDRDAFNEFFQSFTAGSTLGFDLSLTQNLDAGPTPDAFSIAILDNKLFNIPTNGFADTLLHVDIDSANPLRITQLNLSSGTGVFAGVTISAVPEPGTLASVMVGLGMLAWLRRGRG